MELENFIKEVNAKRKTNKNNWYTFSGIVNGKNVQLMAFNTYLRTFEVNGVRYGGICDITVKRFNETLNEPFKH